MKTKLYFLKDVPCIVAPTGIYKKGSVHDIRESDAFGYLKNKQAREAKKGDLESKKSAKKSAKDSAGD